MGLQELFEKAFSDESLQSRFYYELLINDLYVLGEADNDDKVLEDGSELHVLSLKAENESYVPIFLSMEAMEIFLDGNDQKYMKAQGNDLLETLKHGNIVINPGQEASMVLYDDEIQFILSQGKN